MAYDQKGETGKLKGFIQNIKDKKQANKVANNMSLEEMKYKANVGNFKDQGQQTFYRGKGSNIETFTTGSGKGWVSSSGKINPKVSERQSARISSMRSRSGSASEAKDKIKKVGEGLKYGAVELGHTVLDKLPLAGMTVGKRRVFVGDESGTQDYLFGKLTGFNEEKGHYKRYPSMMASGEGIKVKHFDRMTNREWRAEKKRRYTKKERFKNLATKGSFAIAKAATGVGAAIGYDNSGFGTEKGRRPGQGQRFVKDIIKKGAKKIKNRLNI